MTAAACGIVEVNPPPRSIKQCEKCGLRSPITSTFSASRAPVDVHRHAGRRDRHRSDQRAAAGGGAYIDEIRKITQAPIRYVIYSHSHFDHIAGGKPFKDLGAMFVAHSNAKKLMEERKRPDVVVPDLVVDDARQVSSSAARRSNCSISARTTPTAR